MSRAARGPAREDELAPSVVRFLEPQGYAVRVDPDGSGFLDLVAVRGEEVGLVELKLADWKTVLAQATRRRAWGDWAAVVLPRRTLAEKVVGRAARGFGAKVGVWWVDREEVRVLREAVRFYPPAATDPFAVPRAHLRTLMGALLRGEIPEKVGWGLAGHAARTTHSRRAGMNFAMEEFEDSPTT
ncbi:MAG TPA: hypothetical protein VFF67_07715 [Thermoplasmata archaeon]|nr:hypothetical protein [Thermoplasmata archaeon]